MSVFMNIFLAVCFIPVLLIIYFTLRNESKPKNNLILSTTLPKEAWEDERVTAIATRFKRDLGIACLTTLLLYVPVLFIPYLSIQMTYLFVWLIVAMVVPYVPYCKSVQKMRALKKENWYHPELRHVQVADTSVSYDSEEDVSFLPFLLPLIVSLIPLLFPLVVPSDASPLPLFIIVISNALSIALFYVCSRFMFRDKSDRVNANADLSANLTRIRKFYWRRFWRVASWFCAIFSFSALLLRNPEVYYLIATAIFCTALLIVVICIEFRIRQIQQQLNQAQPSEILVDEDDYWPYGVFYYNKNDANNIVNNRVGLGTTMNMAKPFGKWLTGIALLLLLAMPFLGVWLMTEEFSDVRLELTDSELIATHGTSSYEVALDELYSVTLLTELPASSRNWGTAMKTVLKGNFSVKGIDPHCTLCVDRDAECFLLVRMNDGEYYLFATKDAIKMEEIYEELK